MKSYIVTIIPEKSYEFEYRCPNCRIKRKYCSTNKFRVNANKHKIDVWLIYKCEKCDTTKNLTILERSNPESIDKGLYEKYLQNDEELSLECGTNKSVFSKNSVSVCWDSMTYKIISDEIEFSKISYGDEIIIQNPYDLKIRTHKLLANILNLSNSKILKFYKEGYICYGEDYITTSTKITFKCIDFWQ